MRSLAAAALVAGAALLAACKAAPPEAVGPGAKSAAVSPSAPLAAPAPATSQGAPAVMQTSLPYTEVMTGGAQPGDAVPLVVALHGLGDSPEHFVALFSGLRTAARVVAPHSRTAYGTGYTWFDFTNGVTDKAAPEIASMATTVAAFALEMAQARPTLGKPIVTGFSQGGALSFEIGVHHASGIAAAFPVGGWLTPALWPAAKPTTRTSITLFHGTADQRVPFDGTRNAVAHLQKLGFPVELHEYPGVGHAIPPSEQSDLLRAIAKECEKQREAGPS